MSVDDYSQIYAQAGQQYGVDPALLMAMGQQESSGNPNAIGPDTKYGNAKGIAQLIPATAQSLGVTDPNDPKQAIPAQAKLLAANIKRYGNIPDALKAYYGGTDQANWGPQTQAYPNQVLKNYKGTQMASNSQSDSQDDIEKLLSGPPAASSSTVATTSGSSSNHSEDPIEQLLSSAPPEILKTAKDNDKKSPNVDLGGVANFGAGVIHGALPVANSVMHGVNWLTDKIYGPQPHPAEMVGNALQQAIEPDYKNISTVNPLATGAGELTGQIAATAPLLGPVGDVIPVAGNLATRTLARGAQGAAQGAGFNALTGQDATSGAETGAALNALVSPAVYNTGKAGINMVKDIVQPMTESGRNSIVNDIVQGFAGKPLNINSNEIVAGSKPTLAEATGNPGIAQLQDTLRDINSTPFVEREAANSSARNNALMGASGTQQDIETAIAQRSAQAESALGNPDKGISGTLFSNARPVDSAPVVSAIDDILKGPEGQRDAVAKSLNNIRSKLVIGNESSIPKPPIYDANGQIINSTLNSKTPILQNDPETLYKSVRKQINDLIDSKDLSSDAGRNASAQLITVRDKLDDTIEQGAPGFKKYLSDYSGASTPINAMQWMQGLKLTDGTGNIILSKVQNALSNIKNLQNTPGINSAKNLAPDQISTLQNIRDDLLRKQNLTLGKSYGSPTVQKANAANKLQGIMGNAQQGLFASKMNPELSGAAGGAALGSLLNLPGSTTAGAFLGSKIGKAVNNTYAAKNALIRDKLQQVMLEPGSYTPVSNSNGAMASILQNPLLHYGANAGVLQGVNNLNKFLSPQPVNNAP